MSRAGLRPGVYLVTDEALCGPRGVVATVRAAVDAGVRAVQVRDKTGGASDVLRLVEQVALTTAGRAVLLVDDRLDVVLAARAAGIPVDGVHLGQTDLPVTVARERLGPDAVVGLTAHTTAQLAAAECLPTGTVDYLGVGAIRATATKPDHPPVLGVAGFARYASATVLPCVAIGGVGLADIGSLRRAGAAGAAVVTAVCAAPDPGQAARELVAAWDGPTGVLVNGS